MAFDESKHPRVPAGSSEGGEFASGDGPATALYNQTYEPKTVVDVYGNFSAEDMKKIEGARAELASRAPTDASYGQGGFKNPDGTWTKERQQVHAQILDQLFSPSAVAAATPPPGQPPTLVMMGGRAGSGKSTFLGSGEVNAAHFLTINSDDLKAQLPGFTNGSAGLYHEELSQLADQAEQIARDNKLNVIYDATMKSRGGAEARIAAYKKAGYRVEGYLVHVSPYTSAIRATKRFVGGGRYVPAEYALGSTTNELTFDSLRHQMDKWAIYDNNTRYKLVARSR